MSVFAQLPLQLTAACSFGLKALVARELYQLGVSELQVENGKVRFQGDQHLLAQALLWLRTAD